MKHFSIKLLIVLVAICLIDISFGYLYDKVFCNIKGSDEISLIYRSLFTERADALVLGPSSAKHHYNPIIMSDSLGLAVFNAGMDARDVIYSDIILQSFLERNNLKLVILDIGPSSLDGSWKEHLNGFRFFYGRSQTVTDYFNEETGLLQRIKLRSNLYKYNGSFSLLRFIFGNVSQDKSCGYEPLDGVASSLEFTTSYSFNPDSLCVSHLESIVNRCRDNQIQLILAHSPHYVSNVSFNDWIKSFCKNNGVLLLMENENEYWYNHPELFRDRAHLNSEGADELTRRVCGVIMSMDLLGDRCK